MKAKATAPAAQTKKTAPPQASPSDSDESSEPPIVAKGKGTKAAVSPKQAPKPSPKQAPKPSPKQAPKHGAVVANKPTPKPAKEDSDE